VEGIRIPVHVVTVKEEGEEKPSKKGTLTLKGSSYIIQTTAGDYKIGYSRFLNRTPEWKGKHGASLGYDMVWVFPDSAPTGMAIPCVSSLTAMTSSPGWRQTRLNGNRDGRRAVRAFWTTEKGSLAVTVVVMDGIDAGLVEIACEGPATVIELTLNCYPGGYGPAYGTPSIRSAHAGQETVQVAIGEEKQDVHDPADADGIFYCDRWPEVPENRGQRLVRAGLPRRTDRGQAVLVSNYGVNTSLKLRPGIKSAVLALTEYPCPMPPPKRGFPRSKPGCASC